MRTIKFDLGKNIYETAKQSGVAQFSKDDVDGLISYGVSELPSDVAVIYTRPGYEVSWTHQFAFTLTADHHRNPNDLVEQVDLQLDSRQFKSNDAMKTFIEQTIAQFQRGKWKRFISEDCPRVSGRSSLLNLQGQLDPHRGCPLDPGYKMTDNEWLVMQKVGQRYVWVGDGTLAELSILYFPPSDNSSLMYQVFLSFHQKDVKEDVDAKNLARELKKGDAKGWNSTANYRADQEKTAELNKQLEANAIKRGDSIVPSP